MIVIYERSAFLDDWSAICRRTIRKKLSHRVIGYEGERKQVDVSIKVWHLNNRNGDKIDGKYHQTVMVLTRKCMNWLAWVQKCKQSDLLRKRVLMMPRCRWSERHVFCLCVFLVCRLLATWFWTLVFADWAEMEFAMNWTVVHSGLWCGLRFLNGLTTKSRGLRCFKS